MPSLLSKIAAVGGPTLASRVLGFVRDIVTAALLGAGPVADAFFVAFRLPNQFRSLFAEGAFNNAFVPVFARVHVQDGPATARGVAEQVMAFLIAAQLVLLVAAEAAMPLVVAVIAPGFGGREGQFALAVEFSRITFPYLIMISLVALMGGVLNSVGRFTAAAAAPVLLNLCMIGALVVLPPLMPTAGHALSWGVLAAGLAQLLYLAWDCRRAGFSLRLVMPRLTPPVRQFFRALGPAALGSGLVQISVLADTMIASALPTGAVSYLYYADRLTQLPLGLIGVAIGTVLLPELSRHLGRGDDAAAADSQNRAIEFSLLFTLPAATGLIAAGEPLIAVLFQRGAFMAADTAATVRALIAYAAGLPAFVLLKAVLPGFYARGDTATPVKVAVIAIALNVGLKLALMAPLGYVGLAIATSVGAWANLLLLAAILGRRGGLTLDARLRRTAPRILAATLGLALLVWWLQQPLGGLLADDDLVVRLIGLAALLAASAVGFALLLAASGALRRRDLARLLKRKGRDADGRG